MFVELFHFVGSGIRRALLRRCAEGIEPLVRFLKRDAAFRQIVLLPCDQAFSFGRRDAAVRVRLDQGRDGRGGWWVRSVLVQRGLGC